MTNPIVWLLRSLIKAYRLVPKRAETCRYYPSCSQYGLEALAVHGALKGSFLTLRRLLRCHPWGGTGIDRVPPHRSRTGSPTEPCGDTAVPIPSAGQAVHLEEHR